MECCRRVVADHVRSSSITAPDSQRASDSRANYGRIQSGPVAVAEWLDVLAMATAWQYAVAGPNARIETWAVHRGPPRRLGLNKVVNASSTFLSPVAGDEWIAVGDAATAFDQSRLRGWSMPLLRACRRWSGISAGGVTSEIASNSDVVSVTFAHSESGRRPSATLRLQMGKPHAPAAKQSQGRDVMRRSGKLALLHVLRQASNGAPEGTC